jgi:glycosyltransferase involved in cell wall biosynthesis
LKVLQLIQKPQLRGAEIFASQLGNQLIEAGHEVHLMSLVSGNATLPFRGNHIQLNRPLNKRLVDVQGWKALAKHIKAFQPEIIQANAGDTLKFAVFSKLFFGWKAPIVFRNANKVSDFVKTTPKRLFNKFLVSKVRHVISVSELCRQDFVKTYANRSDKTTTVPIGINLGQLNRAIPSDLTSFFATGKVLVHVASFVPEKNHAGLLRIFQNLIEKGENVKLILIGDGKLRPVVEKQVVNMNLTDRVLLVGYRTDVLSIMSNAHAFVLPSLIEGLPGVILEAMYCKTPVVAYNVGGIAEVLRNKETGYLIKAGDETAFVKAVQEVLQMPAAEREHITSAAYDLVMCEYDNKVIAKRFLAVYESLITNRPFERGTSEKPSS